MREFTRAEIKDYNKKNFPHVSARMLQELDEDYESNVASFLESITVKNNKIQQLEKEKTMADKNNGLQEAAQSSLKTQDARTTLGVVKGFLRAPDIRQRFDEVLKDKAPQFLESVISAVASNTNFEGINPNSIIASALQAATLDLPINPNLGFAHIIPYRGKTMKAQFQMGYKGFIQLAIRTGAYKTINVAEVFNGELISKNRFTGKIVLDEDKKKSDEIVGFYAYMELHSGFEKQLYMSVDEMRAHGKKYSKSYDDPLGSWNTNFKGMGLKTVIKLLLSKWGILSVALGKALQADQANLDLKPDGELDYTYDDATEEMEAQAAAKEKAKAAHPRSKSKMKAPAPDKPAGKPAEISPEDKENPEFFKEYFKTLKTTEDCDKFYLKHTKDFAFFETIAQQEIELAYMARVTELKGQQK